MPTRTTDPIFAWALDVLGVRPPDVRGDGGPEDRRAWAAWKARAVDPAGRFAPGRSNHDVHLAREVLLGTPSPTRPAPTSPPLLWPARLHPDVRAHLRVQFGRFGFE